MNIVFEKMNEKHEEGVMSIFNYYVENSTAAFPANTLPNKFYTMLMKKSEGYPSYTLIDSENETNTSGRSSRNRRNGWNNGFWNNEG